MKGVVLWMLTVGLGATATGCGGSDDDRTSADPWLSGGGLSGVSAAPESDSDDDDGETNDGESTADDGAVSDGNATSGPPATSGMPEPTTTTAPDETSGDPVLDGCLNVAADACEECGCNQCLDPLLACEMDVGCVAMRDCAQQSGCTDTISCFEACEGVINEHGGAFGASAELALALADCMDAACPVCG